MGIQFYLMFAQTIFYGVISLAVIVIGILFAVVVYYLLKITHHVEHLSEDLDNASHDVRREIESILEILAHLPLVSTFFKASHSRVKKH